MSTRTKGSGEESCRLADFLVKVHSITNGRWARGDRKQRQLDTLANVAEAIGILWQATQNTEMWNEYGHIHLGLLQSSVRHHRVPGHFKRSLVYETRNHSGQGVTHPRQVLIGMRIGKRKAPTELLSGGERKLRKTSACSQGAKSMALRAEIFEMWNYWLESRIGLRAHRALFVTHAISIVVKSCLEFRVFFYSSGFSLRHQRHHK